MFYMVFVPGGHGSAPSKQHATFEEAKAEAERLAKKQRVVACVLKVVGVAEPAEPPVVFREL